MGNPDLLLAFDAPNSATAGQFAHGYLALPGVAGYYASAPDSVPLSITGDIDIRVRLSKIDWSSGGNEKAIIGKYDTSGGKSFLLVTSIGGGVGVNWSTDGTTSPNAKYTSGGILTNGQIYWIRVTLDVDNGAGGSTIKFYTSTATTNDPSAVTWTLQSSQTSGGVTSIFDSTSPLEIGTFGNGASYFSQGNYYRAQVRNNILDDGTGIVFDADFTALPVGTTSFIESSSNHATVTVNGPVAADSSGNLRDGRAVNGVTFGSAGKKGLAATFDGVNDYVRVPRWATLNQFTVSAWFYSNAVVGASNQIICATAINTANGTPGFWFYISTTGLLAGMIQQAGSPIFVASSALSANTWYHGAFTYDGTTHKLYLNGVLVSSNISTLVPDTTNDLMVGAANPGTPSSFFNGKIDDLRVYPTALSQSDIQSLMSLTSRSPSRPLSRPLTRTTPIS